MRAQRPGRFWIWSLPCVFLLQGVLMWVVALPLQLVPLSHAPLNWIDGVGILVWGIGWLCESVGDWQLARFKARRGESRSSDARGTVAVHAASELFRRLSRVVGTVSRRRRIGARSGGRWSARSLCRCCWSAYPESHCWRRRSSQRRPEYAEYVRRTSAFLPWPPRKAVKLRGRVLPDKTVEGARLSTGGS